MALVFIAGCVAPYTSYRPVSDAVRNGPAGFPAAYYEIEMEQGAALVLVWSEGIRPSVPVSARTNKEKVLDPAWKTPVLDVGFTVENGTGHPISFDARTVAVRIGGSDLANGPLVMPESPVKLAPKERRQFNLFFPARIPDGRQPEDFSVDWTLTTNEGTFQRRTPFVTASRKEVFPQYPNVTEPAGGPPATQEESNPSGIRFDGTNP